MCASSSRAERIAPGTAAGTPEQVEVSPAAPVVVVATATTTSSRSTTTSIKAGAEI